jgi:hypothetical protein
LIDGFGNRRVMRSPALGEVDPVVRDTHLSNRPKFGF